MAGRCRPLLSRHVGRLDPAGWSHRRGRRSDVAGLPDREKPRRGSGPARCGWASGYRANSASTSSATTCSDFSPTTSTRRSARCTSGRVTAASVVSPGTRFRPARRTRSCGPGDGLVGQAAKEDRTLHVKDVPARLSAGGLQPWPRHARCAARRSGQHRRGGPGRRRARLFSQCPRSGSRVPCPRLRDAGRRSARVQGSQPPRGAARGDPAPGRGAPDAAGRAARQQRGARGAGARAQGIPGASGDAASRARTDQLAARGADPAPRAPEGRSSQAQNHPDRERPPSSSAPTSTRASSWPT